MDVKTHGFTRLCPVDEVCAWIDGKALALPSEQLLWEDVVGRIAAVPVISRLACDAGSIAMRDGYALCAGETQGADVYNPLPFALVGDAAPGAPFQGLLASGQAARIAYGAVLPAGADAVLPLEHGEIHEGWLQISAAIAPGEYVKSASIDAGEGPMFEQGHCFRFQDLPILSESGATVLSVHRRPSVRIIATGSELLEAAAGRQNVPLDCNRGLLTRLIARDGGELEQSVLLADDPAAIGEVLIRPGADLVIVTGGSGIGFNDRCAEALASVGELRFHGTALPAARSVGCGCIGDTLVLLLPGNPVSCFVGYDFFAARALRRLAGLRDSWPYPLVEWTTTRKISSGLGRVDYIPVSVKDGRVTPLAMGEPLGAVSLARAQGFVLVPAHSEGFSTDATVPVYLY